jgi:hypothetical protein
MLVTCVECEAVFDPRSPAKQRAGGRINTCPDCSSESVVKYLGLANGDGKQASLTVLAFGSVGDREKYSAYYRNNAGYHKGKSCQLGSHLSTDPGVRFRTVTQMGAMNHKGKL